MLAIITPMLGFCAILVLTGLFWEIFERRINPVIKRNKITTEDRVKLNVSYLLKSRIVYC